jgi:P27 family predicted phage terminase small subunit
MTGRPPKPIEQRVKEGKRGHRPLPEAVRIGGTVPKPPRGSSSETRKVWREIVKTVAPFLDSSDAVLVESLVRALMDARIAELDVDERGLLVEVRRYGGDAEIVRLEKNPSVDIARDARREIRQLCDRFGIGPAARARLAGLGVVPGRTSEAPARDDAAIAGLGELRVVS